MVENIFWLVRGTEIVYRPELMVYNKKPKKIKYFLPEYQHEYDGGLFWHSYHGYVCLNDRYDKRFSDITRYDDPVAVTLVIDNENPDFYIQRYKDCLFISNRKSTCIRFKNGKDVREEYVAHDNRISNKLFPDITEDSGIVGVRLERI